MVSGGRRRGQGQRTSATGKKLEKQQLNINTHCNGDTQNSHHLHHRRTTCASPPHPNRTPTLTPTRSTGTANAITTPGINASNNNSKTRTKKPIRSSPLPLPHHFRHHHYRPPYTRNECSVSVTDTRDCLEGERDRRTICATRRARTRQARGRPASARCLRLCSA